MNIQDLTATTLSQSADVYRIDVRGLSKSFQLAGTAIEAVRDVSFGVRRGEFVALLGPSGSGKSTVLNMIATLVEPSGLALQGVGLACLLLLLLVMHPVLSNPAAGTALSGLWFVVIFFFIGVARMQASGVRLLLSPGNPRGIF